jgi:hypothetical protein
LLRLRFLLMIIVFVFILSGCGPPSTDTGGVQGLDASIMDEIKNEFGLNVYFPTHEKYPITTVYIQSDEPISNRKEVNVTYSETKGELTMDDELKKSWEEKLNAEMLYGEYEGTTVIKLIYSNYSTGYDGDIKEIDGIEVKYKKLDRGEREIFNVVFNTESGSYLLIFHLNETFTKDNAFKFTEKVIQGLNK